MNKEKKCFLQEIALYFIDKCYDCYPETKNYQVNITSFISFTKLFKHLRSCIISLRNDEFFISKLINKSN